MNDASKRHLGNTLKNWGPVDMAELRLIPKSRWLKSVSMGFAALIVGTAVFPAQAQTENGVVVNLGVLDDLDPMATVPRLLMPSSQPRTGRIVLRPPPGVDPITPQRSRVVLRPPPGAPARVTTAPTIAVPPPAAAAPPTSVTAPPPPAPAASPAASAPSDDEQVAETESVSQPAADDSETPPEQTASLPSDETAQGDQGPLSVLFGVDETELPFHAAATLNNLVDQLNSNDALRVQLMAYASSTDGSASSVRRKSLSRALSVREYLMDQGIQSTRIEVRALGDQSEGGEPDRVDAVVEQR